jgi:hypothetical protein
MGKSRKEAEQAFMENVIDPEVRLLYFTFTFTFTFAFAVAVAFAFTFTFNFTFTFTFTFTKTSRKSYYSRRDPDIDNLPYSIFKN